MIKGSTQKNKITILSVYAPDTITQIYGTSISKPTGHRTFSVIVGHFVSHLLLIAHSKQ